jgi:hypothetical protein
MSFIGPKLYPICSRKSSNHSGSSHWHGQLHVRRDQRRPGTSKSTRSAHRLR